MTDGIPQTDQFEMQTVAAYPHKVFWYVFHWPHPACIEFDSLLFCILPPGPIFGQILLQPILLNKFRLPVNPPMHNLQYSPTLPLLQKVLWLVSSSSSGLYLYFTFLVNLPLEAPSKICKPLYTHHFLSSSPYNFLLTIEYMMYFTYLLPVSPSIIQWYLHEHRIFFMSCLLLLLE